MVRTNAKNCSHSLPSPPHTQMDETNGERWQGSRVKVKWVLFEKDSRECEGHILKDGGNKRGRKKKKKTSWKLPDDSLVLAGMLLLLISHWLKSLTENSIRREILSHWAAEMGSALLGGLTACKTALRN